MDRPPQQENEDGELTNRNRQPQTDRLDQVPGGGFRYRLLKHLDMMNLMGRRLGGNSGGLHFPLIASDREFEKNFCVFFVTNFFLT